MSEAGREARGGSRSDWWGRRRRDRERTDPGDVTALPTALKGLMAALTAGGAYLPQDEVRAAEAVIAKAAGRLELRGDHTIAALAGATGSGKSSLFNVLAGAAVSTVGRRRPTTTTSCAAVWGSAPVTALLDWLDVRDRHRVSGEHAAPGLDGLVLLDLPDIDSTARAHRDEADRVLRLCDVFVWVTDPQKYADALVHDAYLRLARDHAAVTLVLLNQADRLTPEDAQACREDLRRLLAADGLPDAEVLLVSATTGLGLAELLLALQGAVGAGSAARARLLGDVRAAARDLRPAVADTEPRVAAEPGDALLDALARLAGVPRVLDAIEEDHRTRALRRVGWPPTRWFRRLRPDPLSRVRVGSRRHVDDPQLAEIEALVARSSLPGPTPTARAAAARLTRGLAQDAAHGLPPRWAQAVSEASAPADADLADALDQAILRVEITRRTPAWWGVAAVTQGLLLAAAAGGALWLGALALLGYLQLPLPETPRLGIVPLPTILLVGGLVLGPLLALLGRRLAGIGARRARERARRAIAEGIAAVARERLVEPVAAVVAAHARTREGLDAALGVRFGAGGKHR